MHGVARGGSNELSPSRLVRSYAPLVVKGSQGKPIVDVACGSGRNALFLADMGCTVFCLDVTLAPLRREQSRLSASPLGNAASSLKLIETATLGICMS